VQGQLYTLKNQHVRLDLLDRLPIAWFYQVIVVGNDYKIETEVGIDIDRFLRSKPSI
jgi:hypothetical protein